MPSKRTKPPTSGSKSNELRSDDEIIKDRKLLEAFDTADLYEVSMGTGMLFLAGVYLLNFAENAPTGSAYYGGGNDVHLALFVCGCFCRGIGKVSPRAWSAWRRIWHLLWCPIHVMLSLIVLSMLLSAQELYASRITHWCLCAAFGAGGVGALVTMPGPSHHSKDATRMPLGRLLIALDGLAVLVLAWSILVGAAREHALGTFVSMLTGLPLAAWAVGLILCQTDAELVAAAPTVMIFCAGSSLKAAYLNGPSSAVPAAVSILLHLALYLPIQAEANPFHKALLRVWKQIVDFMANPVSGFGDGGD